MSHLNGLDKLILIFFIISMLVGLLRGLIKESLSLLVFICAFGLSMLFASNLANLLKESSFFKQVISAISTATKINVGIPASYFIAILSFGLLFGAIVLFGTFITFIINLAFAGNSLGLLNRLLGSLFGFCRAFIISVVLIFLLQFTSIHQKVWWKKSNLILLFHPSVSWLDNKISPQVVKIKKTFENIPLHFSSK
jgi:membrane protein required for colicin V production